MNDDELRQLLEELHQKIEATDLSTDISNLLERTGHEQPTPETTSEVNRLEESIRYFEVTHPTLTATLSQMLNILNNAGI
jgi:polyhydroxyalkanoate synthesis regulator phasin